MVTNNDLFDFMISATRNMAEEYERIQKRALEDPGTAGDQGEENWATLFRNWLPPTYQIVTKGRILSHGGIASPQVDVLILTPEYPRHLLDKKVYTNICADRFKWIMFKGVFMVNPYYEEEFLSRHTDCILNKVEISA